jgi:hypothetical protein
MGLKTGDSMSPPLQSGLGMRTPTEPRPSGRGRSNHSSTERYSRARYSYSKTSFVVVPAMVMSLI